MFKVINFSTLLFLMAIIFSHNVLANDEVNNTINTDEDLINQPKTFSYLKGISPTINELDYFNFIRISIISQPEYLYAVSTVQEKNMSLKYARRSRWPDLSFRIINDSVLKRDIQDTSSIRKIRDDSFDAAVELSQPLYSGGEINARIGIANTDYKLSELQKEKALSDQILQANKIYLSAVKSDILLKYANQIIKEARPYFNRVKERVELGITDPIELATFSVKFNDLESKVQQLKTIRSRDVGVFEYFFKEAFSSASLPEVFIPKLTSVRDQEGYDVKLSILSHEGKKKEVSLTKSEFRPKFGFSTRYTKYDLKDSESENDIRGGVYFNMPIFSFGRGSAKIASSQAKAYAAKTYIDIERKNDEVAETEIINVIHSSQQIREDVFNSYIDTKTQRKIIKDRLEIVSFAAEAYIDSGLRELILLERLIDTELNLLQGYLMFLNQNKELTDFLRVKP